MNVFGKYQDGKYQEKKLLKRINNGEEEAFGQCYDFYAPKLYRHAFYRLGSKELAEDIVADIFVKTWEYLSDRENRIDNLKAFLYRVANNLIVDFYRGKERREILLDEFMDSYLSDKGMSTLKMEQKIEFELALEILDKAPVEIREILIWRYIDELSIGEIALLSGRTKNAVYVAIHRALKEARKLLRNKKL